MIVYNGLVLPLMGLNAGWITSIWVNLLIGFLSYYTASLIITHLGKAKRMKDSVLAHFNGNYTYMRAYGFINWLSFVPLVFLNFNFIILEFESLIGYRGGWIAPLGAFLFILLTVGIRIARIAE